MIPGKTRRWSISRGWTTLDVGPPDTNLYTKDDEFPRYPRLALRFEMRVLSYSTSFFPAIGAILPPGANVTNLFDVFFAQEQRRGDIAMAIDPEAQVRWMGTARLDYFDNAEKKLGSIAEVVLGGTNTLVERLHVALRAVRDGGPMNAAPEPGPRYVRSVCVNRSRRHR